MVEDVTGPGVFSKEQLDKDGIVLTKDFGFLVKEENNVLSFDRIDTPEYGRVLLFGDQVFFLKFWDIEDLKKALSLAASTLSAEIQSRDE